jgi:hypothetical protein
VQSTHQRTKQLTRPDLTGYLIDKGYVTEEQCSEALQRQVIFGGRLGTNLLELFHVEEGQLLEALSYVLRVPAADPEKLEDIPNGLLDSFPEDLAQKFKIIPFEENKGRIHVAMTDPKDMEALDEISFITGKVIKPHVTTELKMGFLLEKIYGIQRDRRFISIPEEEMKRRREWEAKKKQKELEKKRAESSQPEGRMQSPSAGSVFEAPTISSADEEPPPIEATTFQGASQMLAQAANRDDIASTLLTFANMHLERSILFILKGSQIYAWKVGGIWKSHENVNQVRFSTDMPTLVQEVAQSSKPFKGPLLQIDVHKKIIGTLGAPYPEQVVAFPLAIRKRVFSVLYGDNGISGDPFGDLTELRKIAQKAALAFEVLILKAKILFQN